MSQYYVDQEHIEEMARLLKQSRFLTKSLGGLLEDRPDFSGIGRVLDIACGPGEWATEVARQHPGITVVGMDISQRMIQFAQAKAYQDQINNITFEQADATKLPLHYADASFDFINMSLIYAFMTRTLWPLLIKECYRILRPGGALRVIQEDANVKTNSPAMDQYHRLGSLALYKAGQGYYPHQLGVIPRLRGMFKQAGFTQLSQRHYIIDISQGTEGYPLAYEDYKILLGLLRPFLVKWGVATAAEADACYQQFLKEIKYGIENEDGSHDDFVAFWHFSSVYGVKEYS
jgi:ubiquinone/menaquinone biosynthesis C-methylase UbiE